MAGMVGSLGDLAERGFTLALDEIEETGTQIRPRLPDSRHAFTGPQTVAPTVAGDPALPVIALDLDPLTVPTIQIFFQPFLTTR
jgi:hypothetical protein